MKPEDLTNKKIGLLTAIKYNNKDNQGKCMWLWRCDCGKEKVIRSGDVMSGKTKSCGCIPRRIPENLTGQKFNRYTFIKESGKDKYGHILWLCRCDCGTEKIIIATQVKCGRVKSCGCFLRESSRKRMSGKNSPNWNNNLTNEERTERENTRKTSTLRYNRWRKKVFRRDNYTCQCCRNSKGGNLEAHHIRSWSSNEKLRHIVSNGIALCKRCHKNFHKEFGRKNNNKKQLSKFIKNHINAD